MNKSVPNFFIVAMGFGNIEYYKNGKNFHQNARIEIESFI